MTSALWLSYTYTISNRPGSRARSFSRSAFPSLAILGSYSARKLASCISAFGARSASTMRRTLRADRGLGHTAIGERLEARTSRRLLDDRHPGTERPFFSRQEQGETEPHARAAHLAA